MSESVIPGTATEHQICEFMKIVLYQIGNNYFPTGTNASHTYFINLVDTYVGVSENIKENIVKFKTEISQWINPDEKDYKTLHFMIFGHVIKFIELVHDIYPHIF